MSFKTYSHFFSFQDIQFHILSNKKLSTPLTNPVLFLHGFSGSAQDWEFLFPFLSSNYTLMALDLPGHGKSDAPENSLYYSEKFLTGLINHLLTIHNWEKITLVGYSMGGRLASAYLTSSPSNVRGLFLESNSPGIEDSKEKQRRAKTDNELAESLLQGGLDRFIHTWMELELFQGLKACTPEDYDKLLKKKLKNRPIGLYNMLKTFSPGNMASHWQTLTTFQNTFYYVSGNLDKKYSQINTKLKKQNISTKSFIIKDSGHVCHFEKPAQFISILKIFLKECFHESV